MKGVVVIMTDRELNIINRKLMDYIRDNPDVVRKAIEDYFDKMNLVNFDEVEMGKDVLRCKITED